MKQISKLVSELNHLNVQFCEFIDCNKAEASTLCPHHCLKGKKFKKIVTYLPGDYIRYSIQNSIYISEYRLKMIVARCQNIMNYIQTQKVDLLYCTLAEKTSVCTQMQKNENEGWREVFVCECCVNQTSSLVDIFLPVIIFFILFFIFFK